VIDQSTPDTQATGASIIGFRPLRLPSSPFVLVLLDFAVLLGMIAFVMELIPNLGSMVAFFVALLFALVTSPLAVVLVSVFYFVVFNIEGSILAPSIEGKLLDFGGATMIFLVTIGLLLAGIVGRSSPCRSRWPAATSSTSTSARPST
jgi:hypothetical protein